MGKISVRQAEFHISENKEGCYIAPTYLIYEDIPG